MSVPWRTELGAVLIALRVTPNARADRIEGVETRDDGTAVLRVRVRAVPDRGKANVAVIELLSATLGVPKSVMSIVGGKTARLKTVRVIGDPAALIARLQALPGSESL